MKDFVELDKILELCRDRDNYPPIFKDTDGTDAVLPKFITRTPWIEHNRARKITLEITSFAGTSINAIHYYGNLSIEGIDFSREDTPEYTTCCRETRQIGKENPLAAYQYKIEMVRPLTQKEIDEDPYRWEWMEEGSLTNSYESPEEVKEVAIRICKARFEGNWELHIRDYTSNNEDEIIKFNE